MEGQLGWYPVVDADDGIDRWRKGPWTPQEDKLLIEHVNLHGEGRWNSVSGLTGLKRSGKSCRLRWVNYLRPDLKRSKITPHEETIILDLHARWGNRWSAIARSLPGRTDNEIKNYWRTHFKKSGRPTKKVDRARVNFLKQQQEQKQHFRGRDDEHHQQQQLHREPEVEIASFAQEMHDMPYLFQPGTDCGDSIECELGTWGNLWDLDGDIVQDHVFSF